MTLRNLVGLTALFFVATACEDSKLRGVSPKLKVTIEQAKSTSTDLIDFDEVAVGDTAKRRVSVANDGSRSLALSNIQLPKSKVFKVSSIPTAVGAGETVAFIVEFTPSKVDIFEDVVSFNTDDPTRTDVTLKLKGKGSDPNLVLCAPPLDQVGDNCAGDKGSAGGRLIDFGPTIQKFTKRRAIKLLAAGESDVVVQGVSIVGAPDGVFKVDNVAEGTHVPAGTDLVLNVEFSPLDPNSYAAQLVVLSNDPRNSKALVNLQGSGSLDCQAFSESKEHKGANRDRIDILFVIDTSSSMASKQADIKAEINKFIDQLTKTKMNYHIAVATTDMLEGAWSGNTSLTGTGNLVYPDTSVINTPQNTRVPFVYADSRPTVVDAFKAIMENVSTTGSTQEFGTLAAATAVIATSQFVSTELNYSALSGSVAANLKGAVNTDPTPPSDPDSDPDEHLYFYRPHARFATIIVSDEDDGGGEQKDRTDPSEYVRFFKNLKSDPTLTVKYIVITDPSASLNLPTCANAYSGSPHYHSVVNAFGPDATLLSICEDFATNLELAGGIVAVPQCLFDLDSGIITLDEQNNIVDDKGNVYGPGDWQFVAPTPEHQRGQIQITGARCPDEPTHFTIDYVSCLRSYDNDSDAIPNLEDNCSDKANPDQADGNADGVGDICTL